MESHVSSKKDFNSYQSNVSYDYSIPDKSELLNFYYLIENYFLKNENDFKIFEKPFSKNFITMLIDNLKTYNSKEQIEGSFDENGNFIYSNFIKNEKGDLIFKSYPKSNYILIFSNNLLISLKYNQFVFKFEQLDGFNDLTKESVEKINTDFVNQKENIPNFVNNFDPNNYFKKFDELAFSILDSLQERGMLSFLGLRTTPGSISSCLPPDINILQENFKELHTKENSCKKNKGKPSLLTVGARALCKHTHRCSSGFWPPDKGKEIEKNEKAELVMNKIINNCIWINIHGLPGDIPIIEMRIDLGYGLRWQVDGVFRGFLEPQMEGGHEKGWKH